MKSHAVRYFHRIDIYDQNDVNAWHNVVDQLKTKNDYVQSIIDQKTEIIRPMQGRRADLSCKIADLRSHIADEEYRIESQRRERQEQAKDPSHNNALSAVSGIVGALSDESSHYRVSRDYRQGLSAYEQQRDQLDRQISVLENERSQYESTRSQNRVDIWSLNNRISRANECIAELDDRFIKGLFNQITADVEQYDKSHLAGQSEDVRFAISELKDNLAKITTNTHISNNIKYTQLFHLLWCIYLHELHDHTSSLNSILFNVLSKMHVAGAGDIHAIQHYRKKSRDEFLANEKTQYDCAVQTLEKTLSGRNDLLAHSATTILTTVREEYKNNPDYRFFTPLLNSVRQAIEKPLGEREQNNFLNIANQASGHPSLGIKFGGALIVFAGILLITATALTAIATFGGVPLVSAFAIGAMSAAGKSCAIAALGIGGTASIIGGPFLFKSGMRRGLSNDMIKLKTESERVHSAKCC